MVSSCLFFVYCMCICAESVSAQRGQVLTEPEPESPRVCLPSSSQDNSPSPAYWKFPSSPSVLL
jgi:hypothetical protein